MTCRAHVTGRTWLRAAVSAMCGILAVVAVPQAAAQTKDKIPVNPKLSVEPPEGAIVLFGGKAEQMRDNWYARRSTNPPGWTVDDKGVATPNKRDISSKQEFGDCYLHVEFCEPLKGSGNSGVGMEGRYEIQILNSYGKQARGPRVRRLLQPDAAQGDRLQARRRVADVRHLLPRAAVRRRRQGRREGPRHRVPERHPDPRG